MNLLQELLPIFDSLLNHLKELVDIHKYIESGILELYALGLLKGAEKFNVEEMIERYPELKKELDRISESLEGFSASAAISPPKHLKKNILDTLANVDKEMEMDPANLPLINKFSDHRNWLKTVDSLIPESFDGGRIHKVLRQTSEVTQMLLVSSTDFEDELHDDLHESFLILKGICRCTVGSETFFMGAGDYAEIPLYEMHNVTIISPYVVAVLQRIPIA